MKSRLSLILIVFVFWMASSQVALAAFSFSRTVTIDHTKVPNTNQANFPVAVASTTYAFLKTVGNGGKVQSGQGFDIGFYTNSNCSTGKMAWEVEKYTPTTGDTVYWVSVPSVTTATDAVFYMCYGDSSITTDQSATTTVWTNVGNYSGVYHFPNSSALSLLDSTTNALNGTGTNTPTPTTGQIDGGMGLASASTQYVGLGTTFAPTAVTMSAWIKGTSFPGAYNAVVDRANASYVSNEMILVKSTGKLAMYVYGTGVGTNYDGTGAVTLSTGTWYYVTLTYSSTDGLRGYVNGASDKTAGTAGALATASATTRIGSDPAAAGREWNGTLDEVRLSDSVRSADWITTEYNNQLLPDKAGGATGFYTLGSEATIGPAFLTQVCAGSATGINVTSSSIDTTGASILVASVADRFDSGVTAVLTDSKTNIWIQAGSTQVNSVVRERIFYAKNPIVGTGHTFTLTGGAGNEPAVCVGAFSGTDTVAPLDQTNGAVAGGSVSSLQTGSVTPTQSTELVVTGLQQVANTGLAIDSGFAIAGTVARVVAQNIGNSLAYKFVASPVATNPTWSWTTATANTATVIATFKAAAAVVTTSVPKLIIQAFFSLSGFLSI